MSPLVLCLMLVMSFFMGYAMGYNSEDDDF